MMIFTSIYGVVDGYFVSNFAGKEPFTAVNFIYPFIMVLGAFGFMFGTGGSALIAKTLGEGKKDKANKLFSMFVYISAAFGVVIAVFGVLLLRPIASALGAEGELLENCVIYGRILLIAMPAFMLQFEFQSFCATAEKPQLGLAVTIAAGVTNMVLDAVLVLLLPQELKLTGAALATALSQCVGGLVPLIYFARKNDSIKSSEAEVASLLFHGQYLHSFACVIRRAWWKKQEMIWSQNLNKIRH
jgi:Na+-driven multidrug efflux pump